MGGAEEVDQRSDQQGQCLQHQAHRARTFRREPDSRARPLLPEHYEGTSCEFAVYADLRRAGCHCQHEAASGWRTPDQPVDCPVSKGFQEERQGGLYIIHHVHRTPVQSTGCPRDATGPDAAAFTPQAHR